MTLVFDDARLPVDIEVGAKGGMGWSTQITSLGGGAEQINQEWSEHRCTFDIGYGISSYDDLREVKAFHAARRGRARHFLFKDWTDFNVDLELIRTDNGVETDFQIIKTYGSTHAYTRRITRPVLSPDNTVEVYVNGVLVAPSTYDLVAADLGVISFHVAPGAFPIRVTCEFDVPVRFDVDQLMITSEAFEAGTIEGITLIEGRE